MRRQGGDACVSIEYCNMRSVRIASILRLFGGDEDEFRKWNKDFCTFMNYWNKDQKDNRLLKQCANVNEDDYWVT